MIIKRSVVTVAVGKPYYLNLCINLVRSFLYWNKNSPIHFLILTDNTKYFSEFNNEKQIHIKSLILGENDKSFTSKFLLIEHVIAEENLFIDSDCLIYGSLDFVFDKMCGYDFTAIGREVTNGSFFCDISTILEKFNISKLPIFVGSIYYFKNNETSKNIFKKAIELKSNYDELGFIRLRQKENEEPLFAVAMALHNQHPIPDFKDIKADLMYYKACKTNILKGSTSLVNKVDGKIHRPKIVHFNDSYSEKACYLMDEFRLSSKQSTITEIRVFIKYKLPEQFVELFKSALRPIYHVLLGPSKVKKSKRIV